MKAVLAKLRSFDAFGEGIRFTVNGGEKFGTVYGSVLTLLVYALIFIYG